MATIARDYANSAFKADFVRILNSPRNRYMIIDFAAQLFNKLMTWAQPPIQPRTFNINTILMNDRHEKFPGYPMQGIPGTYIKLQGFADLVYNNSNPLDGFEYNSENYNYVSDQVGMYTSPQLPSNMVASDSTVIAVGVATVQAWETAWNTLLRPYENSIGAVYTGRHNQDLNFPSGAWPYLRQTPSFVMSLGSRFELFRLSPGEPDVSLINTIQSTGENNRTKLVAPRGPFIKIRKGPNITTWTVVVN